jgi:hypothetical protein
MSGLQESQKIGFELEDDRKSGKKSAGNLKQVWSRRSPIPKPTLFAMTRDCLVAQRYCVEVLTGSSGFSLTLVPGALPLSRALWVWPVPTSWPVYP